MSESNWQPIETYKFPWEPDRLLIAAIHKDGTLDVFLCHCADGGLFYPYGSSIALDEDGWLPYAWSADIPPDPPQPRKE